MPGGFEQDGREVRVHPALTLQRERRRDEAGLCRRQQCVSSRKAVEISSDERVPVPVTFAMVVTGEAGRAKAPPASATMTPDSPQVSTTALAPWACRAVAATTGGRCLPRSAAVSSSLRSIRSRPMRSVGRRLTLGAETASMASQGRRSARLRAIRSASMAAGLEATRKGRVELRGARPSPPVLP